MSSPEKITSNSELFSAAAEDMPVTIQNVIAEYKLDFPHRDAEERYKWEAVFHYQSKWNLDAPNFAEMLADAFYKAGNLLTSYMYYPYQTLCELARAKPEFVRDLFRQLYDESSELPLPRNIRHFHRQRKPDVPNLFIIIRIYTPFPFTYFSNIQKNIIFINIKCTKASKT